MTATSAILAFQFWFGLAFQVFFAGGIAWGIIALLRSRASDSYKASRFQKRHA